MKVMGWLGLGFLSFGLVFDGGALYAYLDARAFRAAAQHTQGTVVGFVERSGSARNRGATYAPRVRFTPGWGEPIEFTSSSSSSPPEYEVGERVPVLYASNNPQDARLDGTFSMFGVSLIFSLFGVIFTSLGLGFGIYWVLLRRRRAQVLARGTPIQARFVEIDRNRSVRVNGRNPWRINCQWQNPATSNIHLFSSDDIWFDPSPYVKSDSPVRVLILPENPEHYMVDLSFLPQLEA